jgi:transposase
LDSAHNTHDAASFKSAPGPSLSLTHPCRNAIAAPLLAVPARRPERCGEAEHAALAQLRDVHPDVGIAAAFTERFVEIVRERRGNKLGGWLSDAEASGTREIQQFAYKVRRDQAAVEAGCTLPWSNGQTKGQITKLKAIKRSKYGRAKFDLLRRRTLCAA